MSCITLRIFSGLHLGAEIELEEGVYVIGTDDSCDLILTDSSLAVRHAALRVAFPNDKAQVSVEPLDGKVSLSGETVREEEQMPARYPFQLGLVLMAWTETSTAGENAWQEVQQHLEREERRSETSETVPADAPSTATVLPEEAAGHEEPANDAGSKADVPAPEESLSLEDGAPKRRGKTFKVIAALFAAGLAGMLCFTWQEKETPRTPEQIMRALLDEAGYQKLAVTGGKESVTVSGRLASDRERGRLLRLAQLLHFPVYLDVTVRSDAADAVKASFNTLGLFPEVTELPPSSHPGLLVKGYIKNGVLEEQALTEAVRNVPALQPSGADGKPKLALFRDIRHEEDVRILLEPELAAAKLHVNAEYQPGRILLRGAFTPQTKTALEEIVAKVQAGLGVPAPFDIINNAEIPGPSKSDNIYTRQERQGAAVEETTTASTKSSSSSFQVVSVSMGPLRFITLKNGERVFEGGELPGGYVLEHISVDELTLSRNNTTTLYPLRGSHE